MTQHPIHNLPPAELRGYARGLRDTAALLGATWSKSGMVPDDEMSLAVQLTREAWEREAELVEGFAARLDSMKPKLLYTPGPTFAAQQWCPSFEALCMAGCNHGKGQCERAKHAAAAAMNELQLRTAGTYRETEPASQAQDQRWYRVLGFSDRFATLPEAMEASDWKPVAIESSEWAGTRWAIRVPTADGADEIATADTEQDALAFLLPETEEEQAQSGLADAVAENLAEQPPTASEMNASLAAQEAAEAASPIQRETPPPTAAERSAEASRQRAQRSDSPWTDERVALLRRLFPTIMHVDRLLGLLNAMPGLPIPSANAIGIKARKLDIHRRGEPIPEEFADAPASRSRQPQMAAKAAPAAEPPKPATPIVTTAFIPLTTEEMHNLRESFRKKEFGVSWLADEYGMPTDEAQKIVNQLREEQAQKKAKAA
jgi:hypothetical protein